ncbi:MAG: ABC transporter C-terminal domain-containing protein, partial [Candidatus Nanopelagicales bacterium]
TGGVEEYLRLRRSAASSSAASVRTVASAAPGEPVAAAAMSGGEARAVRKELAVLERRTEKLRTQEGQLHDSLAAAATDHEKVRELSEQLRAIELERAAAEEQWLEVAAALE